MNAPLLLPAERMPLTALMLREVFGRYEVPITTNNRVRAESTMEAAWMGIDYAKLVLAGGTKLPILTLVGPPDSMGGLYLRWLELVLGVKVIVRNTVSALCAATAHRGLITITEPVDAEFLAMLHVLNQVNEVCMYPEDGRHHHERVDCTVAIRTGTAPDPAHFRTLHWVRTFRADKHYDMDAMLQQLRAEYKVVLPLLYNNGFLTRPLTPLWFHPDQLTEPSSTPTT